MGEGELALEHLRQSSYYSSYRWVTASPAMEKLRGHPGFRNLLDDLYGQWQKDLLELEPHLRVPPDALPAPEVFLGS